MLGWWNVGNAIVDKNLDDDKTFGGFDEAEVENITNANKYAGKSWAEIKAELIGGNPIVGALAQFALLKPLVVGIAGIIKASTLTIIEYKNPVTALKEDFNQVFKGAGVALTLSAVLAIAWKLAVVAGTFAFLKQAFFKKVKK